MAETTLTTRREGAVLVVAIHRPERGNALDGATIDALLDVVGDLASDPGEVRAVVLRGEGRHFCTGADIGGGGDGGARASIGHIARGLATGRVAAGPQAAPFARVVARLAALAAPAEMGSGAVPACGPVARRPRRERVVDGGR